MDQKSAAQIDQGSRAEIELHYLTHMPYRHWCPIGVRSQARGGYHKCNFSAKSIAEPNAVAQ
eukprot:831321-Amphidinium_carterae.1